MLSCSNITHEIHETFDIDYIDCSYWDGWEGFNSIKIFNDGTVFVSEEKDRFRLINYAEILTIKTSNVQTNFSPHDLDSLSNLIKRIHSANLDSIYERGCVDCGYYYLIIHKSSEITKIFVQDIDNDHEDLVEIRRLIQFLMFLSKREIKECKSIKFESKTRGFRTIPPLRKPKIKPR
jgi:hypothetical protein